MPVPERDYDLRDKEKIMAEFARVNGIGHAVDTLYDTLQIRGFKVIVDTETLEFGIGSNAEALAQEFGTTGALIEFDGTTKMVIIGDAHALDVDTVAIRASRVLGGDGVLDSAGVAQYVTVTAVTSLFGIS